MNRACLVAIAALPVACAAMATAKSRGTSPAIDRSPSVSPPVSPPVAPPASIAAAPSVDSQAALGVAQLTSALLLPFAPAFVDDIEHWQRRMDDALHDLGDRFTALAGGAGRAGKIVILDLTVLSIEPVARTESSGFGWRDDPIRHTRRFHSGTDFRGKRGTPVRAAGDGVVVFCGRLGGYGNAIDIDHGSGVITRYAHLRRIGAKKGAAITAGETIGQVGSTGRTTGPHLHFEVRLNGTPVSPIAAMSIAALQREFPLAGRLAALSLSAERQATAQSSVDPPRRRAKPARRPERPGRGKRPQVLW
jgi:murein DD-endopeptidase MepM/ murein hydrolase activator NlpD